MNQPAMDAKLGFINAYFEDMQKKAKFTRHLQESGRPEEALLLCCVYIETLGNYSNYRCSRNRENFCRVLITHEARPRFALIHPRALLRSLSGSGSDLSAIAGKIVDALEPHVTELLENREVLQLIEARLRPDERPILEAQLWRGSLAAIVYQMIRSPAIHAGRPPLSVTFDHTTYRGAPVSGVGFDELHAALVRIITKLHATSVDSGTWFGHDFKNGG
jgi:hypothetical protein